MKKNIDKLALYLISSRILLYILPWIAIIILFPDKNHSLIESFNNWNRWDAPHYLHIAENGYTNIGDPRNFIVFLPLFPLLVSILSFLSLSPLLASLLLSNMFFVLAGILFYKFMRLDYSEVVSKRAVIALSIFPTAYFFSAPYPESLFFLVTIGSFYLARKEKWGSAGALAGLATLTRPFGILVVISLIVELISTTNRNIKSVILIVLPTILAAGMYLLINQTVIGDPFGFQKILAENWSKHFASPITGVLASWHIAFSGSISSYTLMIGWAEAITTTIALLLIPVTFICLRRSQAVYYMLAVLLFSSTSFILSSPRYLLSIPPFFTLLAIITSKHFRVWQLMSIGLLFYFALTFVIGSWSF